MNVEKVNPSKGPAALEPMKCIHCGKTEEEHCKGFEPIKVPKGCVCADQGGWRNNVVLPICDEYDGNGTEYCWNCEHEIGCHVSKKE